MYLIIIKKTDEKILCMNILQQSQKITEVIKNQPME